MLPRLIPGAAASGGWWPNDEFADHRQRGFRCIRDHGMTAPSKSFEANEMRRQGSCDVSLALNRRHRIFFAAHHERGTLHARELAEHVDVSSGVKVVENQRFENCAADPSDLGPGHYPPRTDQECRRARRRQGWAWRRLCCRPAMACRPTLTASARERPRRSAVGAKEGLRRGRTKEGDGRDTVTSAAASGGLLSSEQVELARIVVGLGGN